MDKQWIDQLPISSIKQIKAVSGGDVNQAYQVETLEKKYFLLVQPNTSKEFFVTEAAGLEDLQKAGITVPEVYHVDEINGDAYLLISFLEEGPRGNYRDLAKMIAKMHQATSENGFF